MVFLDQLLSMLEMSCRFPRVFQDVITLPMDQILQLVSVIPRILDLFNFPFLTPISEFRRRWGFFDLSRKFSRNVWFE